MSVRLIILLILVLGFGKLKAQTDTIPPQFQMLGAPCIQVCKGSLYTDSGFTYYDLPDSFADVTIVQEGSFISSGTAKTGYYKMRYKAIDKAGNIGYSEWRKIQIVDTMFLPNCQPIAIDCNAMDTIPPKIALIGDPSVNVCQCCPYADYGYTVTDNIDSVNDIKIETEGTFISNGTDKIGIYSLRYKATDGIGNISYSMWRTINVRNPYDFPCTGGCCVSVEENNFSGKFNIYPNPANEELFIETTEYVSSVSILTVSGQLVKEININQFLNLPYKIDTKHFPAGVYMVQVKTAQGIINKKVQISR